MKSKPAVLGALAAFAGIALLWTAGFLAVRCLALPPVAALLLSAALGAIAVFVILLRRQRAGVPPYRIPDFEREHYCTRVAIALSRIDFLERLLTTEDLSQKTAEEYLTQLEFNFTMEHFQIFTLRLGNTDAYSALLQETDQQVLVREFARIVRRITDCVVSHGGACSFGGTQNDFVCLTGSRASFRQTMYAALLEVMGSLLRELAPMGLDARVAVSDWESDVCRLPEIYQSTAALFDYAAFVGLPDPILSAGDFPTRDQVSAEEDSPEVRKLRASIQTLIQQHRFEEARAQLHAYLPLQFLSRRMVSPQSFRAALFHYATNFLKACDEALLAGGAKRLPGDQYLAQVVHIATLPEFEDFLLRILDQVAGSVHTGPPAGTKWLPAALKYIAENSANPDLNASAVAGHLGMSLSHVTRVFQQELGCGVYEYIQSYRVGAATELLRQGYTVSELAEKVGFSSVASMNRAFKKLRGITPAKMNSRQEFDGSSL